MGMAVPVMDTIRIRGELGWHPAHSADAALVELLEGIRQREGAPTPPLDPDAGGRFRIGELLSGVGGRSR
jgi:UDP-glucose 4-epimerase